MRHLFKRAAAVLVASYAVVTSPSLADPSSPRQAQDQISYGQRLASCSNTAVENVKPTGTHTHLAFFPDSTIAFADQFQDSNGKSGLSITIVLERNNAVSDTIYDSLIIRAQNNGQTGGKAGATDIETVIILPDANNLSLSQIEPVTVFNKRSGQDKIDDTTTPMAVNVLGALRKCMGIEAPNGPN